MMNKAKNSCDECQSLYFIDNSKMTGLCPDCAHKLYGYPSYDHHFEERNCLKCGWNGQDSNYIKEL